MANPVEIEMARLQLVRAANDLGIAVHDAGDWRAARLLRERIAEIDSQSLETRKGVFISRLEQTGIISVAAEAAGVTITTYARWRNDDAEFKEAADEALAAARGAAELRFRERAMAESDSATTNKLLIAYNRHLLEQQKLAERSDRVRLGTPEGYVIDVRIPQPARPPERLEASGR